MCGIELHGFWWEIQNEMRKLDYEVVFALEVNSHSGIEDKYKIPVGAYALGINPIDGKVVTNDPQNPLIPKEVIQKAELFFQMYRPNKETIAEHIRMNYAKNGDKDEWDRLLPYMLSDFGRELFSQKYAQQWIKSYQQQIKSYQQWIKSYQQWIKDCQQRIKSYQQWIKSYQQWIKDCQQRIKNCQQWIKDCQQRIKNCQQGIKDYQQRIKNCQQGIKDYQQWIEDYQSLSFTGTLDEMDIDKFIVYFLKHPNDYWKDRTEPRKVEYKEFVRM